MVMGTKVQVQRIAHVKALMKSSQSILCRANSLITGDVVRASNNCWYIEVRRDKFLFWPILVSGADYKIGWTIPMEYGLKCQMWVIKKLPANPAF